MSILMVTLYIFKQIKLHNFNKEQGPNDFEQIHNITFQK
jgi:hypothetical protein